MKKSSYILILLSALFLLSVFTCREFTGMNRKTDTTAKSEARQICNTEEKHSLCGAFPYLIMKGLSIVKTNTIY